jgi:uncharacterized phage protein (TIGR02220 family)
MRQAKPWCRLYASWIDSRSIQRLPDKVQLTFIDLLCLASLDELEGAEVADLAWRLRRDESDLQADLDALEAAGKWLPDQDGNAKLANWELRQFRSDSSTPRVRKVRALQAAAQDQVQGQGRREDRAAPAPNRAQAESTPVTTPVTMAVTTPVTMAVTTPVTMAVTTPVTCNAHETDISEQNRTEQNRTEQKEELLSGSKLPDPVGYLNPDKTLPAKASADRILESMVDEVIDHFKAVTGKARISKKAEGTRKHIRARLRDDAILLLDLKAVIDHKAAQVLRGEFPAKYLRIETLFNATKCQSYLAELDGLQGGNHQPAHSQANMAALQRVLAES